jgi:hypothetical protein
MMHNALPLPAAAVSGGCPTVLHRIADPQTWLATTRLAPSAALLAECAALPLDQLDDIRIEVPTADIAGALAAAMPTAGYPPSPHLVTHAAATAGHVLALTPADAAAIRLEVVSTNACRLFHADFVTLRGLLTYIGAGTQWINAADAPDPAPGRINEVPPFTLAVLKGRLMGDHPAILHRSPPIAGTGRKRLLLIIDPVAGAHPACKEGAPIPG